MGRASTYADAAGAPQTRCSTCRTVFEVSPELLSSADTRVRCGECLSIFDALENLRDPDDETLDAGRPTVIDGAADERTEERADEDAGEVSADGSSGHGSDAVDDPDEPESLADGTGSLDVTYSDFDLFSGDAQLPEVAYLDETADTADFDFDSVDIDQDETFSDTLFVHDATIEPVVLETAAAASDTGADGGVDPGFVDDDEPVESLVFEYRDAVASGEGAGAPASAGARAAHDDTSSRDAAPGIGDASTPPRGGDAADVADGTPPARPGGPWPFRVLMASLLVTLLAGLYAYRERDALHNEPLARPALVAWCRVTGCTVPSRVDLASLTLLDRKVFTHPSEPSALVINVAFRNEATFAQRYPVLVVRLRDRLGRVVAERDFPPADYLGTWEAGDTLAAGRRLDITLEVGDPGDGAESYEFDFHEARD